jgi:hypothetical protein
MGYSTKEALEGLGGPQLQRLVRAVRAAERKHPVRHWNAHFDEEFRGCLEQELSRGDPVDGFGDTRISTGNHEPPRGHPDAEFERRKLRLELLRRMG